MRKYKLTVLLLASLVLHSCMQKGEKLSVDEARQIAGEAYIYAYPMLENYKTVFMFCIWEDSPAYEAPLNVLVNTAELSGPENTTVVRPNNDTYYSSVFLDLRREPMIISVPAIEDQRYYSFQLIDLYTHNFDYIGTRATGFDAGHYMIAGPDWDGEKPEGIDKVIQTETQICLALARTQVYGASDAEAAQSLMAEYSLQPLSGFNGGEAPEEPEALDFPPYSPEKVQSAEFISYLNFLLSLAEPHPAEKDLLERFSRIGIGAGRTFNVEDLDQEIREAIEAGIGDAIESIEAEMARLGEEENGWMLIAGVFGDREFMQGKYLTRAAAAMFGIYGNNLEEAYYPETTRDADMEVLDGSKHNYVLHFEKDELPPVKAFWSLTMYRLPEQLLIENEIDRYKIGSGTDGLQYNSDGSLDIYIQGENPGGLLVSNWLPAYDGEFSLQARMYWPRAASLDPLYVPPPVRKRE